MSTHREIGRGMNRRTFNKLAGMAVIGAVTEPAHAQAEAVGSAAQGASINGEEVIVEDDQLLVAFHKTSGALLRLEAKKTSWVMEHRPELGISFRLLAPLPERRDNFVLGQKQKAVEVKKIADNKIQLRWDNLLSEHGGVLQMAFTAVVTLTNGALSFHATLENRTSLTVETIDYPYFGD